MSKSALVRKMDGPLATFASMIRSRGEVPIGPFIFTRTGVVFVGEPSFEDMEDAHAYVDFNLAAAPFWKGDLLAYGETRADFKERLSQLSELTGTAEKTLMNIKSVAEQVPASRRRADVSFGVHAAVAPLAPAQQIKMLELAAEEGLGVREVRTLIRAARRKGVIEGQAELKGKYRVIYLDPDWSYENKQWHGSAEQHYETSPVEEISKQVAMIVQAHARRDAVMALWATAPVLLQNPGPREVIDACGFTYKQNIVWDKVNGVSGHYHHGNHEHLLICTRGSCTPDQDANWLDSVQIIKRRADAEHSEKPEEFRQILERLWTHGPYVELFGRKRVKGWDVMGNDARPWNAK